MAYGCRITGGSKAGEKDTWFSFEIVAFFPIIKKSFITLETWSHMSEVNIIAEM